MKYGNSARNLAKQIGTCLAKLGRVLRGVPDQSYLISTEDWNVLLILDACRADYFRRIDPGAERVWSAANCTREWMSRFRDFAVTIPDSQPILWITANPVVDRDVVRFDIPNIRTLSVWRSHWREFGVNSIASVHPEDVNAEVLNYLARFGQPRRMIVHYLQPHSPYIGDTLLGASVWGSLPDPMSQRNSQLPNPMHLVNSGLLRWEEVRQAYTDNLELVYKYVLDLVPSLEGQVFLTSDHGELLGERDRFGHESKWRHHHLYHVPWKLMKSTSMTPSDIPLGLSRDVESEAMEERLRQLGYL